MKRTLLSILVILGLCQFALAQSSIDSVFIDTRGTFAQRMTGGDYTSTLRADYFNVHMFGHLTDRLTYRIRQRMNVPIDNQNPFRATDWLAVKWNATPKWTFSAGKGAILIGGYEYDAPPIDVYFYSNFCMNLKQGFGYFVSGSHNFSEGQALTFQICSSPLSAGFDDIYSYNLAWQGHITPSWKTIWSANMVEDPMHRMMNWIALGNHWTYGTLAVDLDVMNRASFNQKQFFFTDYTLISKVIYGLGKWNLCGKVGYEINSAENADGSGQTYDTVITAGTEYFYGGVGVEYFPMGTDRLRLHAAYFRDSHTRRNDFEIGLKWRVDIWKR